MKTKKDKELHPSTRVRMVLDNVNVANTLLPLLSKAVGIHETWPRMVVYMQLTQFAELMVLVSKMEKPPTWEQLNVEIVDLNKEPVVVFAGYTSRPEPTIRGN